MFITVVTNYSEGKLDKWNKTSANFLYVIVKNMTKSKYSFPRIFCQLVLGHFYIKMIYSKQPQVNAKIITY